MDLKATYNRIAEEWHRTHRTDSWWRPDTDAFISYLPKGAAVLDVGCGGGVKSKYLADAQLNVFGIDISDAMIVIARRQAPKAIFNVLDMRDVSRLERMFDGVFVQAALLHIPKREAIETLQKLVDVLKPGGYIYIAVKEQKSEGPEEEVKREEEYGYSYERFFSYFTADEVKRYLLSVGVEVAREDITVEPHVRWIQVIGKKIRK
ncbi:MAG: class I SAM-dependent methyltransferase [bacterium]|nr:class I SAM-dependent methyltransferase [bacterium]